MTQHMVNAHKMDNLAGQQSGAKAPPQGAAGPAAGAKGKGANVQKKKKGQMDVAAALKISGGIIACVALPVVVGEVLHAVFHVHKGDTLIVTVALYPVFIIVIAWFFIRALFKPVSNPDAARAPLPPEAADHGTRDDGSALI